MARRLEVEIVGDASSLKRALSVAESSSSSLSSKFGKLAKGAGLVAGAAGLGGLIATVKIGASEFSEASKVTAETNAILKATGGAANVTEKQVTSLAGAILRKTGIDDEQVQAGENMLLTFKNVRNEAGKGNDIFTQSTSILADMAVKFGTDMPHAAIQLGKALNDPIKGISSLHRIGIDFTQGQKDQIAAMVKAGDTMGAQKIILKELGSEFGGVAEATGKTLPGQLNILKETFSNVAGEIVSKMIPAVKAVVDWVTNHWDEIEAVIKGVFDGIQAAWNNVLKPVLELIVEGVSRVVEWVKKHWDEISTKFEDVFADVKKTVKDVIDVVETLWDKFGSNIKSQVKVMWDYVKGTFENAFKIIRGLVETISGLLHGDFGKMWDGIKKVFSGAFAQILNNLETFAKTIGNAAAALGKAIYDAVIKPVAGLVVSMGKAMVDAFAAMGKAVTDAAKTVAGWGTSIAGWIEKAFLAAVDFGAWILGKIKDAAITGATTVAGWATTIVEWLKKAFLDAVHLGAWVLARIEAAAITGAKTVEGWAEKIGGWLKAAFLAFLHFGDWIVQRVEAAAVGTKNLLLDVGNTIGGWMESAFKAVLHFGDWIVDRVKAAGVGAKNLFLDVADTLGGWFESAFKGVLHFGTWLKEKIEASYDTVKGALGDLKDAIVKWLKKLFDWFSPVGIFEDLGRDMMLGLVKGILKNAKDPLHAVKMLFDLFDKIFPGMDWVRDVAGLAFGLVSGAVQSATAGAGGPAPPGPPVGGDIWPREQRVIDTANFIANQRWPYAVGGGHNADFAPSYGAPHWGAPGSRKGYCCSGSVSAAFHAGAYLDYPQSSGYFYDWGQPGYGKYLTTFAKPGAGSDGHVFAVFNGAGWGTGGNNDGGPGWYEHDRGSPYRPRHPFGSQSAGRMLQSSGGGGGTNVDGDGPSLNLSQAMAQGFTGVQRLEGGGILFGGPANDMPGFARGTGYAPGGWALVGEQGPELRYVPQGSRIVPNSRLGPAGSASTVSLEARLPVYLDGRQITESVHRGLLTKQRENGSLGFAAGP